MDLPHNTTHKSEYIICSAIWFKNDTKHEHQPKNVDSGLIVCGRRHHNCFATMKAFMSIDEIVKFKQTCDEVIQGFITNNDRFVVVGNVLPLERKLKCQK